jgi:hypothetical protein
VHADSIKEKGRQGCPLTEERESLASALLCRVAAVTIADREIEEEEENGEKGKISSSRAKDQSQQRKHSL